MSNYDDHLNKFGRARVLDAIYQDSAFSFLASGDDSNVLPHMGMTTILVNGAKPFEEIVSTLANFTLP